jgi:hypothetical protein
VRSRTGWRAIAPATRPVAASRRHDFLGGEAAGIREEVEEHAADKGRWWRPVGLTLFGLAVITAGAELVNYGADGIVHRFAFPAVMGMIVTPVAIEAEEVIRQAVPSRHGRHDVAAGNLIGTLLYFVLFNLGLIALAAPVDVPARVIIMDWPFLIVVTGWPPCSCGTARSPAGRASCSWPSTPATSPPTSCCASPPARRYARAASRAFT